MFKRVSLRGWLRATRIGASKMARNRSNYKRNREEFELHDTCPTGALLQQVIFQPQANEWFKRIHVDDDGEFNYSHPVRFILVESANAGKTKKGQKIFSKPIPKDYLQNFVLSEKPKDKALGR